MVKIVIKTRLDKNHEDEIYTEFDLEPETLTRNQLAMVITELEKIKNELLEIWREPVFENDIDIRKDEDEDITG